MVLHLAVVKAVVSAHLRRAAWQRWHVGV